MAPTKKSKPAESDGEEFDDVDDSDASVEEVEIEDDTLTWVCPTLGPRANRTDFDAVGS